MNSYAQRRSIKYIARKQQATNDRLNTMTTVQSNFGHQLQLLQEAMWKLAGEEVTNWNAISLQIIR